MHSYKPNLTHLSQITVFPLLMINPFVSSTTRL